MVNVTIEDSLNFVTTNLYPESPLPVTEDASEEFDSGELICKHLTRAEKFVEGDKITITIDSKTLHYIVDTDEVTTIADGVYNHTIKMVEDTALLTKNVGANRYFKKTSTGGAITYKDQLDIFQATTPLQGDRLFTIPIATSTFLNVNSEEKKYEGQDLFANVKELFRSRDAIPRLLRTGALDYYSYNYRNNPITIGDLIGERKEGNFANYASSVRSKVTNLTYEKSITASGVWFPSDTGGITPRSSSNQYTDANAQWQLNRRIRRKIVAILPNLRLTDDALGDPRYIDLDISKYIVSKEEWDSLKIGSNVLTTLYVGDLAQRKAMYYNVGGTTIDGLGNSFKAFVTGSTQYTIEMAIISALYDNGYTSVDFLTTTAISNYKLRIFFQPFIDGDITSDKQYGANKRSTMLVSQKDSIVDLGRFGNVLSGTVNRLANDEWQIHKVHDAIADCFEIGDYTADDYVVTKINYLIFSDFVKATYNLTRNFGNLDGQTSVKNSTDPYTINNNPVKASFVFKEYLELSDTNKTETGNLTTLGRNVLYNGLNFDSGSDIPLYNAEYNSADAGLTTGDRISVSAMAIGDSNGIKIFMQFESPNVAGNQLVADGTSQKLNPILYTDAGGGMTDCNINYVNESTVVANDFPVVVAKTDTATQILLQMPSTNFYLQPNEVFGLTHELAFINTEKYLLLEGFATENSLVKELALARNVSVYVSTATTIYTEYDKVVKDVTGISTSYTFDKPSATLDVSAVNNTDTRTWALANSDTLELILAVNYDGSNPQVVYINNVLQDNLEEL